MKMHAVKGLGWTEETVEAALRAIPSDSGVVSLSFFAACFTASACLLACFAACFPCLLACLLPLLSVFPSLLPSFPSPFPSFPPLPCTSSFPSFFLARPSPAPPCAVEWRCRDVLELRSRPMPDRCYHLVESIMRSLHEHPHVAIAVQSHPAGFLALKMLLHEFPLLELETMTAFPEASSAQDALRDCIQRASQHSVAGFLQVRFPLLSLSLRSAQPGKTRALCVSLCAAEP